jgi:hypothetical protein
MIAASSIHGTGAHNLAIASRTGRRDESGMEFGPTFVSWLWASLLVNPSDEETIGTTSEGELVGPATKNPAKLGTGIGY